MKLLTLKDVVDQVAESTGVTKKSAETLLKQAFAFINTSVHAGDEIRIREFGTFKLKERPACEGRNPATGETIQIAASSSLSFKASKSSK